jgi:O-antigen/teichoic acid export membrane protein
VERIHKRSARLDAEELEANVAKKQIRGSSLLLSGRGLAIGAKLASQMLVVRYLSTSDYGAWAYALTVVLFLGHFAHLSLDRAVSRFAAIYHQQGEYNRFFGILLLVSGTILTTGFLFAASLYAFPDQIQALTGVGNLPILLLFTMIFLVPIEALDHLLIQTFAVFGRARAIFFRRYILAPTLQLSVIVLLVLQGAGVAFLAAGWLFAALVGLAINAGLLARLFRQEGLAEHFRLRKVSVPAREVFSFTVPLMASDWLTAVSHSSSILLLGYFYATEQVAMVHAVLPIAHLNLLVMQSFEFLFVPTASRMFARDDFAGINDLYWRTALWIAVLTFPIFALTFFVATPLTVLLFGERYAESGTILAILALGNYFQASLGFNGSTLKVLGKVRYVVTINVLVAIINISLALILIPPFGALGAAAAITATLIIHNLLKQAGLRLAAGFSLVDARYLRPYAIIAVGALGMIVVRWFGADSLLFLSIMAAAVSAAVLMLTKRALHIDETFPEVMRVPLLRAILR